MEPDQRFEIQLGHVCNNRCVFCVSGQMTEPRLAKPVDTEIDRARDMGISKFTFLGGEPTIHHSFFELLEYAVSSGFEEVVIFTNGVRLWNEKWLRKVTALGDSIAWRISLQGADEETHDFTTKKKGAFKKIVTGLETLSKMGQKLSINMCVVEENYRSLIHLPELVRKYDIWQVHLDMVRPRDSGDRTEDYLDGIMPDYEDLGRVIRTMLSDFETISPDFDVNIGNLPYCVVPEWGHKIHHEGNLTFTVAVDGDSELSDPWDKYKDKSTDKLKLDSCTSCVFDAQCSGFFDLYARRRGVDLFRPVSMSQIRELDLEHRLFVLRMKPHVDALSESLDSGWVLQSREEDERMRRIVCSLRGGPDQEVRVVLVPPDMPGGGDGEHSEFCLRIESASVPDHIANTVAGELFDTLAGTCPGIVRTSVSSDRIRKRRTVFGSDTLVTPSIQRRLRRLMSNDAVPGWKVVAAHPNLDTNGVSAYLESANGVRASVHLNRNEKDRIEVSWDFPEDFDKKARRSMMHSVAAALRGQQRATA